MLNSRDYHDLNIGILSGGRSSEREVSIRSGNNVLQALKNKGYKSAELCDIDRTGLTRIFNGEFELLFNTLHGTIGEDGVIQGFMEVLDIPYCGSGVTASAICMNKVYTKMILKRNNIPTPEYINIPEYREINETLLEEIKIMIGFPNVIKPDCEGSSVGVRIIREEQELNRNLIEIKDQFKNIFVERFVDGPNCTVGIIEDQGEIKVMPILELVPENEFYDYRAKYTEGMTEFIIPARLREEIYDLTSGIAEKCFRLFNCRDFARVDIIVEKGRFPMVHEINTLPGLTNLSDLPAEAEKAGIEYDDLIEKILLNTIFRYEKKKK